MKVMMIHEHGRSHGPGAVVAMYRLHRQLLNRGHESIIACRNRGLNEDEIVLLPQAEFLEDLIGKFTWRLGLNDIHCISSFRIAKMKDFQDADVINIHGWHSNYFNYLAVPKLARRKPVVATLHDMWNLTGHCAQSFGCDRWKTGCGKCPHLDAYPAAQRDATAIEWKLKRSVYRRCAGRMSAVAPSKWLCDMVRESTMGHMPVHQVTNAIDTDVYTPIDRNQGRDRFAISPDRKVILYIAASFTNPMKGGDLLLEALRQLPPRIRKQAVLLLVGDIPVAIADGIGIDCIGTGYLTDDHDKALAFSTADVMVMPSRAETQGIVLMESMACGTPVAAFDTGGIGEVVRSGPGGLLAEPENTLELAANIEKLLDDETLNRTLSIDGRKAMEREYCIEKYVEGYLDVYEQTIAMFKQTHSAA